MNTRTSEKFHVACSAGRNRKMAADGRRIRRMIAAHFSFSYNSPATRAALASV
ncbi:hypothetical protein ARMA_1903 [Ardenticatena maritima]|uniref:Uncharacterized protein n=1 Tax=Ardenticatena maritima TaxID=872965 RepID=A0A0M9UD28_9CHLR|nr:hypothetical protein ARMA_1903 [Ardenticatena maritima]